VTAAYSDKRVRPVLQRLLTCFCDEVTRNPSPPAICGIRTGTTGEPLGALIVDECCEGAAFIRVTNVYPSTTLPNPSVDPVRCALPLAVQFELSMWRCAATGTIQVPPSQADWDTVNLELLDDRVSMMNAICCFIGQRDPGSTTVGTWTPVEVQGGCVGSQMTIDVALYGSAQ
jgi:hypothetical protein